MLFDIFQGNFELSSFWSDILLSLPGILLALSVHEAAHAYVAMRCGDHTARLMGRMTINPIKHIDPVGFLMMVFVGVGWAKPVPVNPLHFKNYRRDDLLVSIAGVVSNLLQFLLGAVIMYSIIAYALCAGPEETQIYRALGASSQYLFIYPWVASELVITPALGRLMGYLFQMLQNYTLINISLALFNLLPIPPLDGYHVVNDLLLKRPLFADFRAQRIGQLVIVAIAASGWLGKGLTFVVTNIFFTTGQWAFSLFQALT